MKQIRKSYVVSFKGQAVDLAKDRKNKSELS